MKKNCIKKIVLVVALSLSCLAPAATTLYAADFSAPQTELLNVSEDEIVTYADSVTWVYKTENGIHYRRLYNNATDKWVGDWIVC